VPAFYMLLSPDQHRSIGVPSRELETT
jgi:hypothetical protein